MRDIPHRRIPIVCVILLAVAAAAYTQTPKSSSTVVSPTNEWLAGTPASVGLDESALESLDADLARGKYMLVDSFQVFRCGRKVFQRKYAHDYGRIYGKEAKTKGPLNARLTGPYNYFDPYWHPYYHGTDMHTMQSVTKTVTSVIFGVAIRFQGRDQYSGAQVFRRLGSKKCGRPEAADDAQARTYHDYGARLE